MLVLRALGSGGARVVEGQQRIGVESVNGFLEGFSRRTISTQLR